MNRIPVAIEIIPVGEPLPFDLTDRDGLLLAARNYVIAETADLHSLAEEHGGLYMDGKDAQALQRSYVDRMQTMLRQDRPLAEIASTRIVAARHRNFDAPRDPGIDWLDLQEHANVMLRDTQPERFTQRLLHIHDTLSAQLQHNPDGALFALIYLSATETRHYSATHAMLVSVMCALAARDVLGWPPAIESALRKAALTMNVSMTDLQDKLSVQAHAPDAAQRAAIDSHAQRSVDALRARAVVHPLWLAAVRDHHAQKPGPLRPMTPAQRLARLIQRADLFSARLSPRARRAPITPAAAMQACYLDENQQPDEAGAALIKAVGIYQPGAFVQLASGEIAVVVRRGAAALAPRVAVVRNRAGQVQAEHTLRDTALPEFKVLASVPHARVKIKLQLERMLPLTLPPPSPRFFP